MKVLCIDMVKDENNLFIDLYKVGNIYECNYLYEEVPLHPYSRNNEYIKFEWQVWIHEHNHYQFTDEDFRKYFIDIQKLRNDKINNLLN